MLKSLRLPVKLPLSLAVCCSGLLVSTVPAATTHYVDANGTHPVAPYTSWATAATNIQDAVNVTSLSDLVLVTNGIYQFGGGLFNGSNRVYVINRVQLQSVNGPAATIIKGYWDPGTTNGPNAVRCVYLTQFSSLSGFTLTNGATGVSYGGGVLAEASCTVSNCIITGNTSPGYGGGAYLGASSVLADCIVAGNIALGVGSGGGVYGGVAGPPKPMVVHCLISNNIAASGGGVASCIVYDSLFTGNGSTNVVGGTSGGAAYSSTLYNCTLTGNFSRGLGAADGCTLNNSIIYYNSNGPYADCYMCLLTNCCTTLGVGNTSLSNNSISNAPAFVNPAAGDFHLNVWSPCINAGNNAVVTDSTDLDGYPRIVGGTVDLGAYENQNTSTVHYVMLTSTNAIPPYTNWLTAATNIQDAVDAASAGEFVVVSNGLYQTGGRVVFGTMTNRVVIDKAVTVESVNGTAATAISGLPFTGTYFSTGIRCAYLTNGAVLIGFTLTNGATRSGGTDLIKEQSGGAVWCEGISVTLSNCVLTHSYANEYGGGAYSGTLNNCIISNDTAFINGGGTYQANLNGSVLCSNRLVQGFGGGGAAYGTLSNCWLTWNYAPGDGGGAYYSTLNNCVVSNNTAGFGGGVALGVANNSLISSNYARLSGNGGGAYSNLLNNCVLKNNFAAGTGGGSYLCILVSCTVVSNASTEGSAVFGGTATNCIVYYNVATKQTNVIAAICSHCCSIPLPAGPGNFTNEPAFVNTAAGDFHLQSNSPCINAGDNNAAVAGATDLDGNPRLSGGTVDPGAYEFQNPASIISYVWLLQYGLPTDGTADFLDSDGDGMSNYAEWRTGTNPNDSTSFLRLAAAVPNGVSGTTITWQSVSGVIYFIQRGTDLGASPVFTTLQTGIVGQPLTTSYTDVTASGNSCFYRVGVQ